MRSCLYCPNTEDKVPFVEGKNQCKPCYNKWFRNYYQDKDKREANKKLVAKGRINRRHQKAALITAAKRGKPCADCGISYHPQVMDFDHLDASQKIDTVSHLANFCREDQVILDEIAKCELVCSNCHRIRTFIRTYGKEVYEATK